MLEKGTGWLLDALLGLMGQFKRCKLNWARAAAPKYGKEEKERKDLK